MLDIVTASSASVHALTGSSRPGAVSPSSITTPLASQPACPHASDTTCRHVDAEVIDLAGRVKALATRQDRVLNRSLVIHGRIDRWSFANRPERPEPIPSKMTLVRSRTDTHEVTHVEQSLDALAADKAQREAYEATVAAHEAAVERKRARSRESYLDRLQHRMWRRLERWVVELTGAEPLTQAGLAAKAEVSVALTHLAAEGQDWALELAAAVSHDALRIIGTGADTRAEQDRQADGELFALLSHLGEARAVHEAVTHAFDAAVEGTPARDGAGQRCDVACDALIDLEARIHDMPARTLAGLKAKAGIELIVAERAGLDQTTIDFLREVTTFTGATMANLRPAPLPTGLPARHLGTAAAGDMREWYRSWLYGELRMLNLELDGSPDSLAVRQDNPGAEFHFPADMSWRDVPKPSTRAAAVLTLLGLMPDAAGVSRPEASAA